MLRCWQLLAAVLAEAKEVPVSNHSARKGALIRGSRRYLERSHESYMQAIIQQNRGEVAPPPPWHAHRMALCRDALALVITDLGIGAGRFFKRNLVSGGTAWKRAASKGALLFHRDHWG